ncbi:MAG: hypothetical protein IPF93_14720 [Saprospiraceae bacterium]|nr:hypothetical protein [Saprospiraceae bacterium]
MNRNTPRGWKLNIPPAIREDHEAHFVRVMEKFLQCVQAERYTLPGNTTIG